MSYIGDKILKLTRQLYPTGRAWKLPFFGYFEGLHKALAVSEAQAYEDAVSILYSILPDNSNFTSDDATDWERRLGLITNLATPLASRMLAIKRKMQAPGVNPAKGHYLNLEKQLQDAGFNVYVHENIIYNYPTGFSQYNPVTLNANISSQVQHGDHQHSDVQSGIYINSVIANSIYNSVDVGFNVGSNLRSTFFIGGSVLGTYANVTASREQEFRQLILNIKQVQTVGYLFINYI
jgi:hypothetical protein